MEKKIAVSARWIFGGEGRGGGGCVEERQEWLHELAIPALGPYHEEINLRWEKLSN